MIVSLIEGLMLFFLFICLVWGSYFLFVTIFGFRRRPKNPARNPQKHKISLIIAVKNEEKVVGRLIESILRLEYPKKLLEVVIVEDGSTDRTEEICRSYSRRYPRLIKFFHLTESKGKPHALNFAASKASGDILGVIDGDMLLPPDLLRKVSDYFSNPNIQAIQGALYSVNAEQNLLTKLAAASNCYANFMNQGRDQAGLFVSPSPCFFIRREVLQQVGFWRNVLTEDADLGIRLLEKGIRVRFAPDVYCWQEDPPRWRDVVRQRTRWAQGMFQILASYNRSLLRARREFVDALMMLGSYVVSIFGMAGYLFFLFSLFIPLHVPTPFAIWAWTITLLSLGLSSAVFLRIKTPGGLKNVPLMYVASSLISFINAYALIRFLFGKPVGWVKTPHEGWTSSTLPVPS
jgi:cellulose synthase/poly-beta-1,6-N-acetylglucosamine synthase-like glycosyltransferase